MDQRIGRQGGWAGLLVILLALLIAAYLYKDSLKAYGLLSSPPVVTRAATPGERRALRGRDRRRGDRHDRRRPCAPQTRDRPRVRDRGHGEAAGGAAGEPGRRIGTLSASARIFRAGGLGHNPPRFRRRPPTPVSHEQRLSPSDHRPRRLALPGHRRRRRCRADLAGLDAWRRWSHGSSTLFILQFFRDPPRTIPDAPNAVLSPADGRIVKVEMTRDAYLDRDALKISVFMNVFNVHSNRSPVDGTVANRWYHAGSFLNAALDKASLENERNALHLTHRGGPARDLRADRGPRRAADPLLRRAGRARSRVASATGSSASARAWTCISIPRRSRAWRSATSSRRPKRSSRNCPSPARAGCYAPPPCTTTTHRNARCRRTASGAAASTCCPTCSRPRRCSPGFYAIVQAMNLTFDQAAIAIFVAMVLDASTAASRASRRRKAPSARNTTACPTWCRSAPRPRW